MGCSRHGVTAAVISPRPLWGGGVARLSTHADHGYRYAAGDTIDVTVQTAPAAGATSGSLKLSVLFVID